MSYPPPGPPPPPPGAPGPYPGTGGSPWSVPPPPPGAPGGGPPGWSGPPGGGPPGGGPPGWSGPPGGGPPGWSGPPGGGPAPVAPASKAPWLIAAGVLAVVLLLAAGAVVVLITRDDRADLTEAEMRRALLTAEEVGSDFVEHTDEDEEDDDEEFDEDTADASEECVELITLIEEREQLEIFGTPRADAEGAPSVTASFQGDDNTDVQQTITTDEDDPLDLFREVLEVCDAIGFEDDDGAGELRFGEPDQVEVGDDSLTVEITVDLTEPIPFEVSSLLVIWERNGIVSSLGVTGGVDVDLESRPPDRELLETLVADADGKLEQVIGEDG